MAIETERKFLLKSDAWRDGPPGLRMSQGYLARDKERSVRIRLAGDKAFLTIKGAGEGISRQEFEYAIPPEEARELLKLCLPSIIEKIRHERHYAGHCWEVDEFLGANAGLIVAEIELDAEDTAFEKPDWIGEEVSDDPRYFNACLASHPWKEWGDARSA
ncbi:CYTH domain-containing protein [Luteolibacter sp. Populi]|uniref:CYTH domain-containing protein n=1 Tax=Luteolibacter sp. Populi TaxID=3230487 RepID=UPI0034669051